MNAYIVVESPQVASLISSLLPEEILSHTAVVTTGERSSITSTARTLLVMKRKPIAVLVHANPAESSSTQGLRRDMEGLIRAVSGGVPFRVFMMDPNRDEKDLRQDAQIQELIHFVSECVLSETTPSA